MCGFYNIIQASLAEKDGPREIWITYKREGRLGCRDTMFDSGGTAMMWGHVECGEVDAERELILQVTRRS